MQVFQRQLQQPVPQSYFRLAPQQQQPQQQYISEQQGVWRYSRPVRPQPIRDDQAPHQGLGATDSVTMPEAAPYDPLLVTGPAAAHFVRVLTDREPHFFPAFPHTRLVLNNQQKRLDNGLHANRLGSIRPGSDFIRGD
ncbi:uncharacterized protein LOC113216104 [Frankliniella occidentalis]|uniref:Uncharacterized protein LOC113216104 n=1 Tax=Frankliniella occidentalis TaxID=133901 RepID=A0A6J1TFT1_FRAOC|nr:uncharacterized protein LOC113216104 [Frankliniella occidentalis]